MGTIEEAKIYLEDGFYIALTGYLCKVSLRKNSSDDSAKYNLF
jgi:hypothetical protein